jgi:hypothetical protein
MAFKALPPQHVLLQLLRYEPATGNLFWRVRGLESFKDGKQSREHNAAIWNGRNADKIACSKMAIGYLETSIFNRRVLAHRVVWKMVHGEEPRMIDHIDGDRSNNRLSNLRSVTQFENGKNARIRKNNTSGVMGVRWEERLGKWHCRINVNYRTIHLGVFDQFDEAVAARKAAEIEYGFHRNHGRAA